MNGRITLPCILDKPNKDLCALFYEKKVKYINLWKAYEENKFPSIVLIDGSPRHKFDSEYDPVVFIAYNFISDRSVWIMTDLMKCFAYQWEGLFYNAEILYNAITDILENHCDEDWVIKYDDSDVKQFYKNCKAHGMNPSSHRPHEFFFTYFKPMGGMNPHWKEYHELEMYKCYQDVGGYLSRKQFDDAFYRGKGDSFFLDKNGKPIDLPRRGKPNKVKIEYNWYCNIKPVIQSVLYGLAVGAVIIAAICLAVNLIF